MSKTNKNVLWTGGWDSTYRIIELSREPYVVQPIYVCDGQRLSEKYEVKAMEKILFDLKEKKETKATFLPIMYIEKNAIPINTEITAAYNYIVQDTRLGSQHEWLARLAYVYPNLEIGTESAPQEVSNILKVINKFGSIIKDENDDCYIIEPNNSAIELKLVLGNFKFPIIDKNGQDMRRNIHLWGYEDIIKNVWVCHTPIFGKPCGLCHPCELKIETDMGFLLSRSALKRYKNKNKIPYKYIYKFERKVSKELGKRI